MYGDNKTDKPGFGSGFAARYKWQAWRDLYGMSLNEARAKFIDIGTPLLVERGVDLTDPREPGPDYYEGCYEEKNVEETVEGSDGNEITE